MEKNKNKKKKVMGPVVEHFTEQPITKTLEDNYMPYAMSVIVSRAIPEIDGFKPAHRKLLYTMYKMGLLTSNRTKSANVVGQTMRLNPHGDMAIYETMVRLARGNEALLHPFVDSKGNFGKQYSRDMAFAASRYTEVKLDTICREIFGDIEQNTVDFVDNYDNSTKEPLLLPTAFPNILVNSNQGIAVGMASNICSFNLEEVCRTTIALIKNPDHDISQTLKAPDFSTGGEIIYDPTEMAQIIETGRGGFKVRSKWRYDKGVNCIEVYEIPYTTTVEQIIDRIAELIKTGKIKEITDARNETDKDGLKITFDLKRGIDPDLLMKKLFKMTTLMDTFSCNFNILIGGYPRVMGVREIITEWTSFRLSCVRRRLEFELAKKKDKLHLLLGLKKILLDIDRAIKIIKDTENDYEVVPNLMIGFGIDEVQAEYVAEIKLRNINRQYILNRIADVDTLTCEIADIEETLSSPKKQNGIIIKELEEVIKKYGHPRRSDTVYHDEIEHFVEEEHIEDYEVIYFLTKDSYFKKITPLSLRMGGEHKLKEGDELTQGISFKNKCELLFFTDKAQVYKAKGHDFEDMKASVLGDYLPTKLQMDQDEQVVFMVATDNYSGSVVFAYENGKVSRVPLSCYETKQNRKKLQNAYYGKVPLVRGFLVEEEKQICLMSTADKATVFSTSQIPEKTTRTTQGVFVMTLRGKAKILRADYAENSPVKNITRFRARNIPSAGLPIKQEDLEETQLTL